ncbi:MAG: domain containing protein [Mycobacterium sp.]|nr:domain containing protein [Mycobacterium sp.]
MTGRLLAVSVVHALIPDTSGNVEQTAIDKRPVAGRVAVRALGVDGDTQSDTKHHGGPDQAVYAYASEDAAWWAAELDRTMEPGCFGENLTTSGVDVTGAVIGERWRIGTAEFAVRSPRIPCVTFQAFWGVPRLVKRFTAHGAPGAYLAVLTDGEVGAGDAIEVVDRPAHGLTIGDFFRGWTTERELLPRVADCPDVPAVRRDRARAKLAGAVTPR